MSVLVKMVRRGGPAARPSFLQCRAFRPRPRAPQVPKEELKRGPKLELEAAEPLQPAAWSALLRPAAFTVAFSGGALGCCAIWQYEGMRSAALRSRVPQWQWSPGGRKAGDWREQARQWWAGRGDGEKLFWPIAGLNVAVWGAWRVPALQGLMLKWFLCNPASRATCLPMLLSAFSHYSFIHLAMNMFALKSFMGPAVHLLGKEQFLAVYLSAGVVTSLASMAYKVAGRKMSYSLGASGAICAVLGMFATMVPAASLQLIFLPGFTFSAATGLKAMMAMDTVGLVAGWRWLDHAAHLSGVLLGVAWCHAGSQLLWERRERLVTAWHNLRDRKP